MIYLSEMLGKPVLDARGDEIGTISDIAIATGEVFPRVTSLAFLGPEKTPFMLSWRKFVEEFDRDAVRLNVDQPKLRFSYLQPDEVLLHRDLLNKQIVDTQGKKVVRVNDLKLSESRNQLRLLGAEVGLRGLLRAISPALERGVERFLGVFGGHVPESLIAWNYMDLLDRDLSQVKLSITHKRLHELHPADVADILEVLNPGQRAAVFEHLDNVQAADAISELEDEYQADVIRDLSDRRASDLLAEMDPDDAADIIGDLPYDKAERLLRLMGLEDANAIRGLLGYKDKTAGGIMTPEVTTVGEELTVAEVIDAIRAEAEDRETIYYVYLVDERRRLLGVISLRDLLLAPPDAPVAEMASRDLITADPDDDQEDVAEAMSKYDLLAMPVVDESGRLLGVVTVDDALNVLEEESAEDLAIATGSGDKRGIAAGSWWWVLRRSVWIAVWAAAAVVIFGMAGRVPLVDPSTTLGFILLASVVFLPLMLRTAEEVTSRAIAELIEEPDPEERPSLGLLLAVNGAIGLALGVVVGALAFTVLELVSVPTELAAALSLATGLAILLVMLSGVAATLYARRRVDADKRVSATALSTVVMVFGALAYLGLSALAGVVVERISGA